MGLFWRVLFWPVANISRLLVLPAILLLLACGSPAAPGVTPASTAVQTATEKVPVLASPTTAVTEPASPPSSPTAVPPEPSQTLPATEAGATAPAVELDPCTLVTPEEASAALGEPVGEPQRDTYPNLYSCSYPAGNDDKVDIIVTVYDSPQDAADSFQMELDINQYEQVSGLGDRALRPAPIMDLTVDQGRYELSLDVVSSSGDPDVEYQAAHDLAEKALPRLP